MGCHFGPEPEPAKWSLAKARLLAISSGRDSPEFEDPNSYLADLRSRSKATKLNTQYSPYAFPEGSQVHGLFSGHGKQSEARMVRTS
jgi:hypothetical protein